MLYELFYYSKKADRDAFKHLGYKIKGKKYDDEDDYEDDDDDEDEYEGYEFTDIEDEDEDKV